MKVVGLLSFILLVTTVPIEANAKDTGSSVGGVSALCESPPTNALNPPSFEAETHRLSLAIDVREKETELLRRTVDSYRDQTTLGLALVGLLLGLVGIILPFIAYLTSILPARRVVAEARQTLSSLDERFSELANKHHRKEIQDAIDRLSSNDHSIRRSAASYLGTNSHFPFDDKQIFDICQVAENADYALKSQLLAILSGRDAPAVARVLEGVLKRLGTTALGFVTYVLRQLLVPSGRHLRGVLKDWLSQLGMWTYAPHVLIQAAAVSTGLFQELLDDRDFLKGLSTQERAMALSTLRASANMYGAADIVENSDLAKAFAGRVVAFVGQAGGRFEDADPKVASMAFVYEDGVQKSLLVKGTPQFQAAVDASKTVVGAGAA